MSTASAPPTSPTLLGRLRSNPTDQTAWSQFVDRYGPAIYGWCRARHLQPADAEDVTQAVLARIAAKMRDFAYDSAGSFRGWLRTLTHHALYDYFERRAREAAGGLTGDLECLQCAEAREDLAARLQEEYDLELLDEAMGRVRLRVPPAKWEVFRLMALEGLSGAEVAARLGLKVATAFVIRSKVLAMLREEVLKLEPDSPPDGTRS